MPRPQPNGPGTATCPSQSPQSHMPQHGPASGVSESPLPGRSGSASSCGANGNGRACTHTAVRASPSARFHNCATSCRSRSSSICGVRCVVRAAPSSVSDMYPTIRHARTSHHVRVLSPRGAAWEHQPGGAAQPGKTQHARARDRNNNKRHARRLAGSCKCE